MLISAECKIFKFCLVIKPDHFTFTIFRIHSFSFVEGKLNHFMLFCKLNFQSIKMDGNALNFSLDSKGEIVYLISIGCTGIWGIIIAWRLNWRMS